ncbi:unnamed protein product, partial [Mesorhabditis spiculigera]
MLPCCLFLLLLMFSGIYSNPIEPKIHENNTGVISERTEYLLDQYFPILMTLCNATVNETAEMDNLIQKKHYAEVKELIDAKVEEFESQYGLEAENDVNITEIDNLLRSNHGEKYIRILEAYHNATIYSIIRGLWNVQLYSILPPIDQQAILSYFEDKLAHLNARKSMWRRFWEAVQGIFWTHNEVAHCWAESPKCVREMVEGVPIEERKAMQMAADQDDLIAVDKAMNSQINDMTSEQRSEFSRWKSENYPPLALMTIIYEAGQEEKDALERLRQHGLLSSLKAYYRATIEIKEEEEQQEILDFVKGMNQTFAACYNPSKTRYRELF